MKSKLPMLLLALCMALNSYAQVTVKGKVTDTGGGPLPGATIALKESAVMATTNNNGEFSISVKNPQTAVLDIRFVGYKSQSIILGGRVSITIKLVDDASSLNEVVVTALGISRETKSLGYSRQSVNVSEMTEARDPNITNMLAGKVAGLQIVTSGQSTGSTKVLLRGVNSLSGSNEPLWVVDGIPIDNSHGQEGSYDYGNGASALNPDDIETIEVLKGPNAAALYGSRAANGAILVITKKGKRNQGLGISASSNFQINSISELPLYQNVYGEGADSKMVRDINKVDMTIPGGGSIKMGNEGRSYGAPMLGQPYASYSGVPGRYVPQPNNVTDFYRSSIAATQNISVSSADQNSSYRISYTFLNSNDVIEKQNNVNRHNLALNGSKTIKPWLKVDTRLQYFNEGVENRTARNLDPNSPMSSHVFMMRSFATDNLIPWKDASGNSFGFSANASAGNYENPYWTINENYNRDDKSRFIGGVTTTVGIFKDLKFRAQIAADLSFTKGIVFIDKGGIRNSLGMYRQFDDNNQNWNTEGLLMYSKKIKDFTLNANFGGNLSTRNFLRTSAQINALANHDLMNIGNAIAPPIAVDNPSRSKINSLFGTATIGYKNYLFLDLTGRNDWSSTLPAANRSFFYPSASVSFVFTDYFKIPADIMSLGKVRASVAKVGKDTNPYSIISAFGFEGIFNGVPLINYENSFKDPNLKPEQTVSTELGLNISFLKGGRITFDGTVYKSSTSNQIFNAQVPRESGFQNRILNAGEIQNKGIELSLTGAAIKTKDFSWNVLLNWSANRNKVISLAPGIDQFQMGNYRNVTVNAIVGQPIGVMLGTDFYKDANGNVIVNTNGRPYPDNNVYLGSFLPKWLGAIGSSFRYKAFDLSFNLSFKMGGKLYSGSKMLSSEWGTSIESMEGRDDYYFSAIILGENDDERKGLTSLYTTNGNKPYLDLLRRKGMLTNGFVPKLDAQGRILLDENGRMIAGATNPFNVNPFVYWPNSASMTSINTYDASFIKLNQLIFGYNFPLKMLKKTPFQNARLSFVGRNLWTIYKNTPQGIDPESANTSGNAQGIETGGSVPYSTYGFDLKLNF